MNVRTAAGKWAGRFGYVRHDVISRKTKNRQIKIRQLESETNPPNLIPAKFSGYTVLVSPIPRAHWLFPSQHTLDSPIPRAHWLVPFPGQIGKSHSQGTLDSLIPRPH